MHWLAHAFLTYFVSLVCLVTPCVGVDLSSWGALRDVEGNSTDLSQNSVAVCSASAVNKWCLSLLFLVACIFCFQLGQHYGRVQAKLASRKVLRISSANNTSNASAGSPLGTAVDDDLCKATERATACTDQPGSSSNVRAQALTQSSLLQASPDNAAAIPFVQPFAAGPGTGEGMSSTAGDLAFRTQPLAATAPQPERPTGVQRSGKEVHFCFE